MFDTALMYGVYWRQQSSIVDQIRRVKSIDEVIDHCPPAIHTGHPSCLADECRRCMLVVTSRFLRQGQQCRRHCGV